jgi:hypothetical protein
MVKHVKQDFLYKFSLCFTHFWNDDCFEILNVCIKLVNESPLHKYLNGIANLIVRGMQIDISYPFDRCLDKPVQDKTFQNQVQEF